MHGLRHMGQVSDKQNNFQSFNHINKIFSLQIKLLQATAMYHPTHVRKTSLHQKLEPYQYQHNQDHFAHVRSLKQSPHTETLVWLRATHHHPNEKYFTKQQVLEELKNKKQAQAGKKYDVVSQVPIAKAKPLEKISKINMDSALYLIQSAIKQCALHHSKFGYSYFSIKYCYLNQENKFFMTNNNNYNVGLPISDETIITRDIIESIHKICNNKSFDDFYSYYKRTSLKNKCDFKYTLSLIKSYSKCAKIIIADQVIFYEQENQKSFKLVGAISAQKSQRNSNYNVISISKKSLEKKRKDNCFHNIFNRSKEKDHAKLSRYNQLSSQRHVQFHSPTAINKIKIQQQYNVVLNPINQASEKKEHVKQSTVSTNFKSSLHRGDSLQVSVINQKVRISNTKNQSKDQFLFLPKDLDEVQSLGESSDQQSQTLPRRNYETPKDCVLQSQKKQNEERIISINNWTRTLKGLLSDDRDLKQSFTEGSHRDKYKTGSDPENLKKMVRTVVESILPEPSQFYIKNT